MKRIIFISLLFITLACSKEAKVSDDTPMMMNAVTKSPTDFGADTPVFLFWLDTDFNNISEDTYTQPYLTAWPYLGIDSYKPSIQTYNTGKRYPDNDQEVFCTGFFPATLIIDEGAEPRSWTKLSVPSDDIGVLDVMVAPEHITGKSTQHFDTKDPEEPLVFIHAQSKVSFKAKMGTDMAQNRYLRNIRITIPGTEMMSTLKWEDGRYIADGTADESYSVILEDPSSTQLDPSQKARDVGHIFIYPNKESLAIDVEVEMSDTPLFTESERLHIKADVPFNLTDNISPVLRENDAYEIILVINYDSIALKGRKAEWEEGGSLLIPIYPN